MVLPLVGEYVAAFFKTLAFFVRVFFILDLLFKHYSSLEVREILFF